MSNINYTITSGEPPLTVTLIGATTNMTNNHASLTSGSFTGFAQETLVLTVTDNWGCTDSTTLEVCTDCYAGYTSISNGNCLKIDSYTAPTTGTVYTIDQGSVNSSYNLYGAAFFSSWNYNGTGNYTRFGLTNSYWTNLGANTGPLNRETVWASVLREYQDVSFTYCFDLGASKTYYVGFGCDNVGWMKLNGTEILRQVPNDLGAMFYNNGHPYGGGTYPTYIDRVTFRYWFIYPVELQEGENILQIGGWNKTSAAAIGAVIYDNTYEDFVNANSDADLNILFQTSDKIGQDLDYSYTTAGGYNGYHCDDDYGLNTCSATATCDRRIEIPCNTSPAVYSVSNVYKAASYTDLCSESGTIVSIYSSTASDTLREGIRYYNLDGTAFDGTGFYFANPQCNSCEYGTISISGVYNAVADCIPQTLATVFTSFIFDVTQTAASVACGVSDDGNSTVTEKGAVYSTSTTPTTADNKVVASIGGTGNYSVEMTGLSGGVTYYVRAYAINSVGTSYGGQLSFTTTAPPTTTTTTTLNLSYYNAERYSCGTCIYEQTVIINSDVPLTINSWYSDGSYAYRVTSTTVTTGGVYVNGLAYPDCNSIECGAP